MLKKNRILLGLVIGAAALDAGAACAVYLKKKGIILRDIFITAVDEKLHPRDDTGEAAQITIE